MTQLVVDSSVVLKWFFPEPYTLEARHILNDYQAGVLDLFAPDLIYAEVGNIVWKKHRFQGLEASDAKQILTLFGRLTLKIFSCSLLLDQAYQLAVTHQRTVYDALYLALSLREQCPFVTADERFANALSSHFTNIIWVADWPAT